MTPEQEAAHREYVESLLAPLEWVETPGILPGVPDFESKEIGGFSYAFSLEGEGQYVAYCYGELVGEDLGIEITELPNTLEGCKRVCWEDWVTRNVDRIKPRHTTRERRAERKGSAPKMSEKDLHLIEALQQIIVAVEGLYSTMYASQHSAEP